MLKLTVEQKCDIATRELDEVREELQRKKAGMERAYDNYKVSLGGYLIMCMRSYVHTLSLFLPLSLLVFIHRLL